MKTQSFAGLGLGLFALCALVTLPSCTKPSGAEKTPKAAAGTTPVVAKVADESTKGSAPAKGTEVAAATAVVAKDAKPVDEDPTKPNRWWNQWAGSSVRNNTPVGKNIPAEFEPGDFDTKSGEWKRGTGKNVKWVARLGSQSYGNPVVADGKVFVGTNNGAAWLKRYPSDVDLGCLLCFNEADGKFLWQHSSEKLAAGRVNDWPQQGICCAPYIEGKRGWFVTSRGEVVCFDTEGFHDGENNGPFKTEKVQEKDEADVIWVLDMMGQLGTFQHNMCSCSITATGDILWVNTSNGVDEGHVNIPAPNAPSFLAVDKNTGKVIWSDKSPGLNILHGQWSSPTYAVLGGVPQVMFAGGDGYLYSFRGEATPDGKAELLWKFDANPKESIYILGGRGTRNEIIGTPVVYDGLVYLAVGQDPEHGEGQGHLWCIDPTKRGDVSPELAFDLANPTKPMPHKRMQAVDPKKNEAARPNPNSALVWHYGEFDQNGNGKVEFEETMHRTCGTVTIKDGLLYISDFSGLFHCLDAKTGKPHWTHDLFAATWGSALIVDDKVYVGDEEGKVNVFKLGPEKELLAENNMGNSVYSTPVVANNVLYIANKTHLFAIEPSKGE
jgi:outer membrane protein assembly factor BamB